MTTNTRIEWTDVTWAAPYHQIEGYSSAGAALVTERPIGLKSRKGNDMAEWPRGLQIRQHPRAEDAL